VNALLFMLREVFAQELGDFSECRRARLRPHAPTWLTNLRCLASPDIALSAQAVSLPASPGAVQARAGQR
jgi:hypothetical protein